jgi:hypothetical protein
LLLGGESQGFALGYLEARLRRSDRFFFNYNPEPVRLNLPPETKFVLGGAEMPAGLTIIEPA